MNQLFNDETPPLEEKPREKVNKIKQEQKLEKIPEKEYTFTST